MKRITGLSAVIIMALGAFASLVSLSATADSRPQARYVLRDGRVELVYPDTMLSHKSLSSQFSTLDYIGTPKRLHLANNLSREHIGLDMVLPGEKHSPDILAYTGKGVVIGVIDCGIDPNHITFRDAAGNSRVKRYIFTESSEESADGRLKVSTFSTPAEILNAPIDSAEGGHGTHTTATAAGSWRGNPYYGMAPGAGAHRHRSL